MDSRVTDDLRLLSLSLREGELILGRFKILGPPKVGGESLVFKVTHITLGGVKAVKLIPVYEDGANTKGAVMRQIKIWQEFQKINENILRIEDVDAEEVMGINVVAFQMEYSDVGSLHDVIGDDAKYAGLEPTSFFRIALGVVRGFMATSHHRENADKFSGDLLFHGDIKPQNVIMIQNDATMAPRIIDFGISVASHERGKGFSLAYAAPERLDETTQGPTLQSELYSLGVTLYEFLYRDLPVHLSSSTSDDREARRTLLETIRISPIEFPHPSVRLAKEQLDAFNAILANLLQRDAADRTLSVSQIQRRLEELETEAREEARKTRKSAYTGRDGFLWNPDIHHEFGESEFLFLVGSTHFSSDSHGNVAALLSQNRIDCFSMDTVYGAFDHIVSFWTRHSFEQHKEMAAVRNAHFSSAAIMKLGQTRTLKGRLQKLHPMPLPARRKAIKELVEADDERGLKRLGYITGRAEVRDKDIRVFTFVGMTGSQAKGGDTLYDAIYNQFSIEGTSSLISSGRLCQVVDASETEQNTRFVIEFSVSRYERIFEVLNRVTERCSRHECSFRTFLSVSHKPVRLSDDGEFLGEIMDGG